MILSKRFHDHLVHSARLVCVINIEKNVCVREYYIARNAYPRTLCISHLNTDETRILSRGPVCVKYWMSFVKSMRALRDYIWMGLEEGWVDVFFFVRDLSGSKNGCEQITSIQKRDD